MQQCDAIEGSGETTRGEATALSRMILPLSGEARSSSSGGGKQTVRTTLGVSRRPPPPGFGGGVRQRSAILGSCGATKGGELLLARMIHFNLFIYFASKRSKRKYTSKYRDKHEARKLTVKIL